MYEQTNNILNIHLKYFIAARYVVSETMFNIIKFRLVPIFVAVNSCVTEFIRQVVFVWFPVPR